METPLNFNCMYNSADEMTVLVEPHGILFKHGMSEEDTTVIVLSLEDALKLAASINACAAEASPKPAPAPKPQGYTALTPLAQKVYQHMNRAGSISAREAMADHGITSASLARRIVDIEEAGFKINRERRTHPLTNQQYTRYSLAA